MLKEEEEEEEDGQIVSLCDSRIKRVRDCIAFLSMLTIRVVALEYNQLHKKAFLVCEFGGFENYCVMRASVPSLYNVYRRYDIYEGDVGMGDQKE